MNNCFLENTEVMTLSGVKKIQDIKSGDKVISHTGKVQNVLQLYKNLLLDRKIYLLKVYKTKDIYVTSNHRFCSIKYNDITPRWRPVSSLDNSCGIGIPCYNGKIKEDFVMIDLQKITIDKDIAKYLGLFMFVKELSIQNENLDTIKKLFNHMFNNRIWPNMINWDNELIYSFMNGLTSDLQNINIKISQVYINDLYHLFRIFGIEVQLSDDYLLFPVSNDPSIMLVNNVKFLRIIDIVETDLKPEYVYTFSVDVDYSYNVEGLLCEN